MTNWGNPGYLDGIRLSRGPDALKKAFRILAQRDQKKAVSLLSEERLRFPSLYLLLPEIGELGLYGTLNPRNRAAADLCARKRVKPGLNEPAPPPPEKSVQNHRALRWMFETGADWDGPLPDYDAYDAVLDAAAAQLIITYRDKSILPAAAELLFRRNRKDLYIHDLAWCFFSSFQPEAALYIARYLMSDDTRDVALACRLLHLGLPEDAGRKQVRRELFRNYRAWLQDNKPFLYFTGEHFNLSGEPVPLRTDPEAVYLQKEISPKSCRPVSPLSENERSSLQGFRECPREEQNLLSDYSRRLKKQNQRAWEAWIRSQPAQQVSAAKFRNKEAV